MVGLHPHPHTHYAGVTRWLPILSIRPGWHWLVDPRFALAVLGAIAFWGILGFAAGAGPLYPPPELLSLILLQPVVEELLFRGLLQGHLLAWSSRRHHVAGLTVANILTAVAFTVLHFGSHPPLWAVERVRARAAVRLLSRPPSQRGARDRAACFLQRGLFPAPADRLKKGPQ
jgi:hypothetical protein